MIMNVVRVNELYRVNCVYNAVWWKSAFILAFVKNVSNVVVHPVRKWILYMTSTGMGFPYVTAVGLQAVTAFLFCVSIYSTVHTVSTELNTTARLESFSVVTFVTLLLESNPVLHVKAWVDICNNQEELVSLITRLCNMCIEKRCIFQCCINVSSHSWLKQSLLMCLKSWGKLSLLGFLKEKMVHTVFRYLISNSTYSSWLNLSILTDSVHSSQKISTWTHVFHKNWDPCVLSLGRPWPSAFPCKGQSSSNRDLRSPVCHLPPWNCQQWVWADCLIFAAGTSALFFKDDNSVLKGKDINSGN